MTPPEGAGPDRPARAVVWSAGEEPRPPQPWHGLRRWLLLVVVAGAASFILAYALHLVTAATPAVPTSGVPVWVPDKRGDACPASRPGTDG